jgi:hypothetical protein
MTLRPSKPRVLRSKRGVALLLFAIIALFAVLYVAVGATAFLRTQEQEPTRQTQTAPDAPAG